MGNIQVIAISALVFALVLGAYIAHRHGKSTGNIIAGRMSVVVVAIAVVIILFKYVLGVFIIPSESMLPTLAVGDRIIVNKFIYRFHTPHFQDVIVFSAPPSAHDDKATYVKRVIGLPGDTIQIVKGFVFRNGYSIDEPYLRQRFADNMYPKTVPAGHLFVMGDNRGNSADSRDWGYLDIGMVIGRANLIITPRKHLGYIQ